MLILLLILIFSFQLHCCGVKSWKDYQTEFVPARIVPESCCIPATKDICTETARTNPEQNKEVLFDSVSSLCNIYLGSLVATWWKFMATYIMGHSNTETHSHHEMHGYVVSYSLIQAHNSSSILQRCWLGLGLGLDHTCNVE